MAGSSASKGYGSGGSSKAMVSSSVINEHSSVAPVECSWCSVLPFGRPLSRSRSWRAHATRPDRPAPHPTAWCLLAAGDTEYTRAGHPPLATRRPPRRRCTSSCSAAALCVRDLGLARARRQRAPACDGRRGRSSRRRERSSARSSPTTDATAVVVKTRYVSRVDVTPGQTSTANDTVTGDTTLTLIDPAHPDGWWHVVLESARWAKDVLVLPGSAGVALTTFLPETGPPTFASSMRRGTSRFASPNPQPKRCVSKHSPEGATCRGRSRASATRRPARSAGVIVFDLAKRTQLDLWLALRERCRAGLTGNCRATVCWPSSSPPACADSTDRPQTLNLNRVRGLDPHEPRPTAASRSFSLACEAVKQLSDERDGRHPGGRDERSDRHGSESIPRESTTPGRRSRRGLHYVSWLARTSSTPASRAKTSRRRVASGSFEAALRFDTSTRRPVPDLRVVLGATAACRRSWRRHASVVRRPASRIGTPRDSRRGLARPSRSRRGACSAWRDVLVDRDAPRALDAMVGAEDAALITSAALELPPQWRAIIVKRFGLDGGPPMTLAAVGETLGLSRERVRQIEAKAMRAARARLEAAWGRAGTATTPKHASPLSAPHAR